MKKQAILYLVSFLVVAIYGNVIRRRSRAKRGTEQSNVTALACNSTAPSTIINNAAGEYPWHVAIKMKVDSDYIFQCGGILLSQNHLLTAAHCITECTFENGDPVPGSCTIDISSSNSFSYWKCSTERKYQVIYGGDLNTDDSNKIRYVTQYFVHPSFKKINNTFFRDDLVMMYWSEALPEDTPSCQFQPVLSFANYNQNCFSLGYKSMNQGKTNITEYSCGATGTELQNRYVCATSENLSEICKNNSGSPVICQSNADSPYVVVGIFSSVAETCPAQGSYAVFTHLNAKDDANSYSRLGSAAMAFVNLGLVMDLNNACNQQLRI